MKHVTLNRIAPLYADDIQAAFDTMVRHLASMTERSMNDGRCAYRADGTPSCRTRCVVGALLPDDRYMTDLEDLGVRTLPLAVSAEWHAMAAYMQALHDNHRHWGSGGFRSWEAVRHCARHHDLSDAAVDEVTA